MSTRCQIGFYENEDIELNNPDVLVYKHSDGYPEGIMPMLVKFLRKNGAIGRRTDTEYLSAWFLYFLIKEHVKEMTPFAKKYNKDPEDFLGHGISDGFHGDIEYFYAVYPEKVLICDGDLNIIETEVI